MASKLSYLSKYGAVTSDDNPKKTKKGKKKKSKHHDRTVRDLDDISNLIKGEIHEEEDAPVVVDAQVLESSVITGNRRGFMRVDNARHDSDDESARNVNGRQHADIESESRRRRRHDSDLDDSSRNYPKSRRRRHDSDSERHDSDSGQSTNYRSRRRRHDSDSEQSTSYRSRRRRHDSSDDESKSRISRRHDSSDDELQTKRRHDSDADQDVKHKKRKHENKTRYRHDSSSEEDTPKMSSGHKSGLQSSKDFAKAERKLQHKKKDELYSLTKPEGNTIYRDAQGKRRTVPMGIDKNEADVAREEEEKSRQLNMGTYQKQKDERVRAEFEEAKDMPLARGIEDRQMEERKKNVIREGDPMALYAWTKQQEEKSTQQSGPPRKPIYKGPPPKANRYGIRPGYRWDGIDRSNGFEDRLLSSLHSRGREKEEAYKWSSADM